jgi:hypothetical protein
MTIEQGAHTSLDASSTEIDFLFRNKTKENEYTDEDVARN